MRRFDDRSVAGPLGACSGLLVSDQGGLALAPLDGRDMVPLGATDFEALSGSAPSIDTRLHWTGADDLAQVPSPVVLRIQDGRVLAWHEGEACYVVLTAAELAVLHAPAHGRRILELSEAIGLTPAAVAEALASLAALRVLDLEASDPGGAPPSVASATPVVVAESTQPETPSAVDPAEAVASGPEHAVVQPAPDGRPEKDLVDLPPSLWSNLPQSPDALRIVAYRIRGRVLRRLRSTLQPSCAQGEVLVLDPPIAPVVVEEAVMTAAEPEDRSDPPASSCDEPAGPDPATGASPGEVGDDGPPRIAHRDTDPRVPVFAVYHSPEHNANLGLGLIMAYARTLDAGALNATYDLRKAQIDAAPMLDELARRTRPAVFLFSDYMWSIEHNLVLSAAVKDLHPHGLTVHGGPHAPKYEGDAEAFFADNPHVDVLVRGEGEVTVAALLAALGGDLDPAQREALLSEVEGITFRVPTDAGYRLVRTDERARHADMADFPSPYLLGEFDHIDIDRWRSATVESNRGCPYGCTYCDWGSATLSRIRQFPLDRVKAELEWLAARGISEIFLADANFGIFERDVEIARHIAALKTEYGAPAGVICSFAKNTTKHTTEIVRAWVGAGICSEGSVALQTVDEVTLRNVKRSNIRVERYDDLADEFRRLGLPIVTDLLMGLPGATVASFKTDLQRCIDRDVTPRMLETVVLPNSPMNEPGYRAEFQIVTDESNVIVSSVSYTRDDFDEMLRLRLLFRSLEHYGLLRHLFRWLQHEHNLLAVELIHDIDRAISAEPAEYPLLTWVGRYFDLMTIPPGGWPPFYDEVVRLLEVRHGIVRDEEMDTVLAVQAFLMPTRRRSFPDSIQLNHDYVAWYQSTYAVASFGEPAPRLRSYGPSQLIVEDPAGVCDGRLLRNYFSMRRLEACDNPFWVLNDWELQSDLTRPMATAVPVLSS